MSLPRYIINLDEFTDDFKKEILNLISKEINDKYPQLNTDNIEALLADIKELLPSTKYEGLKRKIEDLVYGKYEGIQKIDSKLLDIPPMIQKNKAEFKFDKDVYITGLHFNQTGWKKEDTWDLIINKEKIINNATIKEIGEHKFFNTYFKVNANTPISFILNNLSGNSRQTMIDLEYIKGEKATITVKPPEVPSIDDIPNDWDVAVVLEWETNTNTDLDLHAIMDDTHVYYGNREENGLYLNFDYTSQDEVSKPEIISVKGNKNKTLKIYINNFNEVKLNEQANIKIYKHQSYGNRLLKEFNVNSIIDKTILQGVCEINLNTLQIKNINENLGGR